MYMSLDDRHQHCENRTKYVYVEASTGLKNYKFKLDHPPILQTQNNLNASRYWAKCYQVIDAQKVLNITYMDRV